MGEYTTEFLTIHNTNVNEVIGALNKVSGFPQVLIPSKDGKDQYLESIIPFSFINVDTKGRDVILHSSVKFMSYEDGIKNNLEFWSISQLGQEMGDAELVVSPYQDEYISDGEELPKGFFRGEKYPKKKREDYSQYDTGYTPSTNTISAFQEIFGVSVHAKYMNNIRPLVKYYMDEVCRKEDGGLVLPHEYNMVLFDTYKKYGQLIRAQKCIFENYPVFYAILTYKYWKIKEKILKDTLENMQKFETMYCEKMNEYAHFVFNKGMAYYGTIENVPAIKDYYGKLATRQDNIYKFKSKLNEYFKSINTCLLENDNGTSQKIICASKCYCDDSLWNRDFYDIEIDFDFETFNPIKILFNRENETPSVPPTNEGYREILKKAPLPIFTQLCGYYLKHNYDNNGNVNCNIYKSKNPSVSDFIPNIEVSKLYKEMLPQKIEEFKNAATIVYLNVPFDKKDLVSGKARWDGDKKKWFIFKGSPYFEEITKSFS